MWLESRGERDAGVGDMIPAYFGQWRRYSMEHRGHWALVFIWDGEGDKV